MRADLRKTARTTLAALASALLIALTGCGGESAPPDHVPSIYAVEQLQEALALSEAGAFREALEKANAAIDDDPRFPEAQYWKGALLVRLGHFEDARVTLHRLFDLAPEHPEARMLYGLLLEKADQVPEARASYEMAVETYAKRIDAGQDGPANHLEHAIAVFLHRGRTVGLQAIAAVVDRFPDYQPAKFIQTRIAANDRDFFLRQAVQPNRHSALSGRLPLPFRESVDTPLSGQMLEPLRIPETQE